MKKISRGLITAATAAALATAGTTTAAAQTSSAPAGGWDPIVISMGDIPDYAKMSSDTAATSSKQRDDAVSAAAGATGASEDDVNVGLGVGATIAALAAAAALYVGASNLGMVPPLQVDLPRLKLPQLPSIPGLPQL